MIGLAAVAALIMSAVAAGSASAAHEWLKKEGGVFSPVTTSVLVLGKGTLTLASGGVEVECTGKTHGLQKQEIM
jgi:hypothetical protein